MSRTILVFLMLNVLSSVCLVESQCSEGCDALASYYLWPGATLNFISPLFSTTVNNISSFNPQIIDQDFIVAGSRLNVPFSCGCINNEFMAHEFRYRVRAGDYYGRIAEEYYSNLTTVDMLVRFNAAYPPENIPVDAELNVVVNCSCGRSSVSRDYGLFVSYPLRAGENLSSVASELSLPQRLMQDYNPGVDFSRGNGLVFIPGKDQNGSYPPLKSSSSGISGGGIAGISIAAVIGAISLTACFFYFVFFYTNTSSKKATKESFLKGITAEKSVEFTYEELAVATHDFSLSHEIGQGGFGAVYHAELRGEKAAIKKMDMKASKEFLAELNVLTHVHHVNLVRLIGYCVEVSLFLVYEYIDNGNLSQHLRGKVKEPLPWSTRLQIALDSARGLEYIHEHTVPAYIHRDIKCANILIDTNFRAKVADFGLTKLTGVGRSGSMQTRLVGTFGYMPPECAQYGDASPKIDVYAFGVVLFELISAKEAIVRTNEAVTEYKSLAALFEEAFNEPNQTEGLRKLVDPRLADDYPMDSVYQVAHLAKACTHENPRLRPSMRSIVVALSSSTGDWDIGSFYGNQGFHLMSGR